jgi:hypothetical protein
MTTIIIDKSLSEQLSSIDDLAELCNEQGKVVGYFFTGDRRPGQPPPGFEVPLSREEIERRRNSRVGRTTQEILRGLGLA